MANPEMQKIFKRATQIAKELRAKNPNLKVSESVSMAWKTPEIKKLMEEYRAKHPKTENHKTKKPKAKKPKAKKTKAKKAK